MIKNGPVTYTYDSENRLISTAGMSYIYDGDGNRVEKCTAGATPGTCAANATGRFYWWLSGSVFAESDLSVNWTAAYGLIRGQIGARIDLPSNTIHYYFHDHLGSTDVVTDALGNVQNESDYYPYGGEIPILSGDTNRYKFNGKERDAESGLDNFGARFDTSAMGRFMTPDWAAKPTTVPYANFGNPQSLNLYSYVENNPTTLGDPDGHGICNIFKWSAGFCKGDEPNKQTAQNQKPANGQKRSDRAAQRHQMAVRIVTGVRGVLDVQIGVEKIVAGAVSGASTPATGPLGAAGAAYGVIGGTGQTVQGGAEIVGAITGHVQEANDAADAIAASTTIAGVIITVATNGNVKAGAAAASVEQLGTSALKRDIFEHLVENGLALIDAVRSGGDPQ